MSAVSRILSKIFIGRFYIRNTGFFLLLFYLLFGVVDGGQLPRYHYTLLLGIVGSVHLLLLALLLWLLYNLKCMAYVLKTVTAKEYSFLYATLGSLQGPRKRYAWALVQAGIYAPVLIYSGIAVVVACFNGYYGAAVSIVCFNGLMCALPLWVYDRQVRHPGRRLFFVRWQHWLNRRFRKPFPLYYIYELLLNNMRMLAGVKVVSALVLIFTFTLLRGEAYDVRAVLTGWLICLLIHSMLVFDHRRFEDRFLAFARNLPVPLYRRYIGLAVTYTCLLLPEYGLLLAHTPLLQIWDILLFMAFGGSLLLLFHGILLFPRLDQDKYLRWVLALFCVLLFLVLGYLYWPAVTGMQLIAACLFAGRYYRYEPEYEKSEM